MASLLAEANPFFTAYATNEVRDVWIKRNSMGYANKKWIQQMFGSYKDGYKSLLCTLLDSVFCPIRFHGN